jgi:hypothetical protein
LLGAGGQDDLTPIPPETLRRIVRANLDRLEPHAKRHGVNAAPSQMQDGRGAWPPSEPGLLLVRDLRRLHLLYAEASIDYVILGQGAKAARDGELAYACAGCHAQTLRGMKWTVTRIKTASPQALTSEPG